MGFGKSVERKQWSKDLLPGQLPPQLLTAIIFETTSVPKMAGRHLSAVGELSLWGSRGRPSKRWRCSTWVLRF